MYILYNPGEGLWFWPITALAFCVNAMYSYIMERCNHRSYTEHTALVQCRSINQPSVYTHKIANKILGVHTNIKSSSILEDMKTISNFFIYFYLSNSLFEILVFTLLKVNDSWVKSLLLDANATLQKSQ